jgi:hypothetical protein
VSYDRKKSLINPGPTRKSWDTETGLCPWGHAIDLCMTIKKTGAKVCKINNRNRRREAWRRANTPDFESLDLNEVYIMDSIRAKGGCMEFIGSTEFSGDYMKARIVLVCDHVVFFRRALVDGKFYKNPLYCPRCTEWRLIHEISSEWLDKPALVIWHSLQLERTRPLPSKLTHGDTNNNRGGR